MNDLDVSYKNCKEAVLAAIKKHKLARDCEPDIFDAFISLKYHIDGHDCDKECSHEPMDYMPANGVYVIEAKNLNEETRIEKFIEELNSNPYTP